MVIVLDSGPIGVLASPGKDRPIHEAREWMWRRLDAGDRLVVPEVADYEVRRELIRASKTKSVERLDNLCEGLDYEPLTTGIMREAAELWADARNHGYQTASDAALDADVILAAQARAIADDAVVVATTNMKHLKRYVDARLWTDL